jgi:4-amino-4-deoxy-L-arabinose transferase-like glycosyltransferase
MGGGIGGGRLGPRWIAAIVGLSAMVLLPGLASLRLTYHEAHVAQAAREMIAAGDPLVPRLDGRPWLEKPPLLHWLIIPLAGVFGDVTELAARLPSALATTLLALAVATLAARRFGPAVGGLAGCVQATMAWSAIRGRLAEADILLACLVAWTMVALDSLRSSHRAAIPSPEGEAPAEPGMTRGLPRPCPPGMAGHDARLGGSLALPGRESEETRSGGTRRIARLFLLALGTTALAKGIGFGAALILAATVVVLIWDRDRKTLRSLLDPPGLALAAIVGLAWPALVLMRYPAALGLWSSHVADRLAERPELFAGRSSWWAYLPAVLGLTLPWTPLALLGTWTSLRRAARERFGPDRLLWAWAVGPLVLLSMATVKNAHYAIHALPPWSIWSAIGLIKAGSWLEVHGRCPKRMMRRMAVVFAAVALAIGLGLGVISPRFDRRWHEWAFYEEAGRQVSSGEPVVILYDDWDRLPYPSPFGPMPHDLPIRLYYLGRSPSWREGAGRWPDLPDRPFVAIGRDRDVDGLARLGRVERVAQGPPVRWDRTYSLFRVTPEGRPARDEAVARASGESGP